MASLIAIAGTASTDSTSTPYVPSAPVQIGTPGPHHWVHETGSWQVLVVMFALVLALGAAVLMFAVRERTRVLRRRAVRRMGEAAARPAARPDAGVEAEGRAAGRPRPERVT